MGHDIVPIGKHSLNINSVAELAADLSQRLQANIKYGYQQSYNDYLGLPEETAFKIIILGEIKVADATANYFLEDRYHQVKQAYAEQGDVMFNTAYLKANPSAFESIKAAIAGVYYDFTLQIPGDEPYAYINKETITCHFFYYSRWWGFCRVFTTENTWDEDYTGINNFRLQLKTLLQKLGGSEMIYIDDQGPAMYIDTDILGWDEITHELNTKFTAASLDIPDFMRNKIKRKAGDYPLVFLDNFSDL